MTQGTLSAGGRDVYNVCTNPACHKEGALTITLRGDVKCAECNHIVLRVGMVTTEEFLNGQLAILQASLDQRHAQIARQPATIVGPPMMTPTAQPTAPVPTPLSAPTPGATPAAAPTPVVTPAAAPPPGATPAAAPRPTPAAKSPSMGMIISLVALIAIPMIIILSMATGRINRIPALARIAGIEEPLETAGENFKDGQLTTAYNFPDPQTGELVLVSPEETVKYQETSAGIKVLWRGKIYNFSPGSVREIVTGISYSAQEVKPGYFQAEVEGNAATFKPLAFHQSAVNLEHFEEKLGREKDPIPSGPVSKMWIWLIQVAFIAVIADVLYNEHGKAWRGLGGMALECFAMLLDNWAVFGCVLFANYAMKRSRKGEEKGLLKWQLSALALLCVAAYLFQELFIPEIWDYLPIIGDILSNEWLALVIIARYTWISFTDARVDASTRAVMNIWYFVYMATWGRVPFTPEKTGVVWLVFTDGRPNPFALLAWVSLLSGLTLVLRDLYHIGGTFVAKQALERLSRGAYLNGFALVSGWAVNAGLCGMLVQGIVLQKLVLSEWWLPPLSVFYTVAIIVLTWGRYYQTPMTFLGAVEAQRANFDAVVRLKIGDAAPIGKGAIIASEIWILAAGFVIALIGLFPELAPWL